jgi:hypothetical protein
MLRMVDALDFHTTHGEVCPAGWNKGDEGMKDTPEGVAEYLVLLTLNLYHFKLVFRHATIRAHPIFRDIFPFCPWCNPLFL